ncbi:hypothetical protein ACWD6P_22750 [Streptomyces sp. NPDC002446]
MKAHWLPGSERVRLTALYGGLLVLAGVMLIGLVYVLVREGLYSSLSTAVTTATPRDPAPYVTGSVPALGWRGGWPAGCCARSG